VKKDELKIMIVAGEDSGDTHATHLIQALREMVPDRRFRFFGAAGRKMREAGVDAIVKSDKFAIVGVPEVVRAVPMFLRVMRRLVDSAAKQRPDLAILVDFPEFNLKLAKKLKKLGVPVVYYISPQLWAWRKYRVKGVKKYVDLMLTILPFESAWYAEHGVEQVEYVGNPLTGKVRSATSRAEFRQEHGIDDSVPVVAFLPGSRGKEIERILPVMLDSAESLQKVKPGLQILIALSSDRFKNMVEQQIEKAFGQQKGWIDVVVDQTYEVLNASDAAVVASGTATLETAILGTPQVIVYKTTSLNNALLRPLISVETFGLANLIAGRKVFKELIQEDLTTGSIHREVVRMLEKDTNKALRRSAAGIKAKLGSGDASKAAASKIKEFGGW
jgi:lipid-A-disaccharide synthase